MGRLPNRPVLARIDTVLLVHGKQPTTALTTSSRDTSQSIRTSFFRYAASRSLFLLIHFCHAILLSSLLLDGCSGSSPDFSTLGASLMGSHGARVFLTDCGVGRYRRA